jgi:hypothetical protein
VSRRNLVIASVALIAVAGVLAYFTEATAPDDATPATGSRPAAALTPTPAAPVPVTVVATPAQRNYAIEFHASDDLLGFVRRMFDLAEAGDTVAMYYIDAVRVRCDTQYAIYFRDDENIRDLTLDEALEREGKAALSDLEEVRSLYGQCRRWKESPPEALGDFSGWLEKSANAGYPPAQANWASHLLSYRGNHEVPTSEDRVRARELALASLRSRDPEAYYDGIHAIRSFRPASSEMEEAAWYYAACFRGVDCGPHSRSVRAQCSHDPACQPYEDSFDLLRRGPHSNVAAEIERRAREISDLIDAGRWHDLGIRD